MARRTDAQRGDGDITGSITDVVGLRVGHFHRRSATWRTGTTVVVSPEGAVAGVDVRGGGPGTRETDLLRPENLVSKIHAICLTGGSAFGLAAADGVMSELELRRIGFPVGAQADLVVPIVPAAVIFDLGRARHPDHRPDREFGIRATRSAFARTNTAAARRTMTIEGAVEGAIGAGTGARAGGLQGGVGMASRVVDLSAVGDASAPASAVVSALAVVNAVGSVVDPRTALPWETTASLRTPNAGDRRRVTDHLASLDVRHQPPLNTTIGVVATDLALTKAECTKVATVAHDGLARAIRPAHSMHDGDTIFSLATGGLPPESRSASWPLVMNLVLQAAADVFAVACTRAVVEATHIGGPPSYRDLCPSAFIQ